MEPTIVYDSCVIRGLYKNKLFERPDLITVMWFQKYELSKEIKKDLNITYLEKLGSEKVEKRDDNFLLLDRQKYVILTYDKELKRKLKQNKYKVVVNLLEALKDQPLLSF